MHPAVIWAAGEQVESPWGVIGIAVSTVGVIIGGYFAYRAKRNSEPNGGSSPHDAVMGKVNQMADEVNALTRQLQTMDERSVVEQRNAHDVRRRLLDGQDRLEARQTRLADRQDEQAAMIDRLHVRIVTLADHIEAAGAQADAAVDLVQRYHQTGG